MICQPSLGLIVTVQMIGGAAFNDLAADANAVMSF